ncbi:MAG: thiamine pyrophosphate-binding protein [Candidatus Baldrarchaeia archaeon]
MSTTVARGIAKGLLKFGVKRVYGIIGTSILEFIDSLYDFRDKIRFVTTRHEQVAVSMADAEGRLYSTLLKNPDFVKLAESFGAKGIRVDNDSEAKAVIKEMLKEDKPVIVDLIIDPNDMPPFNLEASLKMSSR